MPAHVEVTGPAGRTSRVVCTACELIEEHPRTAPAQTAAQTHNTDHHPRITNTEEQPA